ncbi:MAG TPA: hypothetical protein VN495_01845 [Candidatus Paceibacterota bacterium]|nr:hypothetical protein [Candidatus Paceibacterota bacterium]
MKAARKRIQVLQAFRRQQPLYVTGGLMYFSERWPQGDEGRHYVAGDEIVLKPIGQPSMASGQAYFGEDDMGHRFSEDALESLERQKIIEMETLPD